MATVTLASSRGFALQRVGKQASSQSDDVGPCEYPLILPPKSSGESGTHNGARHCMRSTPKSLREEERAARRSQCPLQKATMTKRSTFLTVGSDSESKSPLSFAHYSPVRSTKCERDAEVAFRVSLAFCCPTSRAAATRIISAWVSVLQAGGATRKPADAMHAKRCGTPLQRPPSARRPHPFVGPLYTLTA